MAGSFVIYRLNLLSIVVLKYSERFILHSKQGVPKAEALIEAKYLGVNDFWKTGEEN